MDSLPYFDSHVLVIHVLKFGSYYASITIQWAGNVGQLIKKLANLYKQKLIERNKNKAESEKTSLALTMYDNKLSTTDTLYNSDKRMHTGF
jgi:hypothetical protein